MSNFSKKKVVVIGAGPAGLTAGSELLKSEKCSVKILEKDAVVGGISKTTEYKGCKFDIGPHHFITESERVDKWWKALMDKEKKAGNPFILLRRFTRIYYNKHFFYYPLQAFNVLKGLSFFECIRCVLSYIKVRLFPIKNVKTFEDWVTNQFGYRLFSIFFKTYTEKLWGLSCKKISSDWAVQRIKGFSLSKAIFYAFFGRWFKKHAPRTLSDEFYYPLEGAGTLWERAASAIRLHEAGTIILNEIVLGIEHKNNKITSVLTCNPKNMKIGAKKLKEYKADYFFSTMPLKTLILSMDPLPPKKVICAATKLCYRILITVNFIVNKKDICPDHWIYVHEKDVGIVRIDNMSNFSMKMTNNPNYTSLSLEYFTFYGSEFWSKSDKELIKLGKREIEKIGFMNAETIIDGMVLREPEAYPVYDEYYQESLKIVRDYLAQFSNLHLMGRNGLHQYNNMDTAMLSAFKVVDTVLREVKIEKTQARRDDAIKQVTV